MHPFQRDLAYTKTLDTCVHVNLPSHPGTQSKRRRKNRKKTDEYMKGDGGEGLRLRPSALWCARCLVPVPVPPVPQERAGRDLNRRGTRTPAVFR